MKDNKKELIMGDYRHISFQKRWEITVACAHKLGQCSALSTVFTKLPLLPEDRRATTDCFAHQGGAGNDSD